MNYEFFKEKNVKKGKIYDTVAPALIINKVFTIPFDSDMFS